MTFYKYLSQYYDEIFAATPGDLDFLKRRLIATRPPDLKEKPLAVLDVGCGTGNKTALLAQPGLTITGLDLDQHMIDLARCHHSAPGVTYQVGDLRHLTEMFAPGQFDGLLCLGNTLPHLTNPAEIKNFGAVAAQLLKPGGLLAIQILNYDAIVPTRLDQLPLITTENTLFERFYDWAPNGDLTFRARLTLKGGQVYESSLPLRPLMKNELAELVQDGFAPPEFYGGLDGRPYAAQGLPLMMVAVKK